MTLKLYGMPMSNYFNMVRHALLEKGIAHEVINVRPSQEAGFLAKSPMGKVPFIETPQGCLSETDAILDYLEDVYPQTPLMPADAFARAKVRQLMKVQELYVETPIHNLVMVLFGREVPAHVKEASLPAAKRGMAALASLARFQPWLTGEQFTCADILVFYSFVLSNRIAMQVYQWDMLQELPQLAGWYQRFSEREATRQLLAEMEAAQQALANRK